MMSIEALKSIDLLNRWVAKVNRIYTMLEALASVEAVKEEKTNEVVVSNPIISSSISPSKEQFPFPSFPLETEEIKARVSMREVFERYAGRELKRVGKYLIALCPLHPDHHPSFVIFGDNRFKCFGCGKGGDIFEFVKEYFGLSFPEAKRKICEDFGLMREERREKEKEKVKEKEKEKEIVSLAEVQVKDDMGVLSRVEREEREGEEIEIYKGEIEEEAEKEAREMRLYWELRRRLAEGEGCSMDALLEYMALPNKDWVINWFRRVAGVEVKGRNYLPVIHIPYMLPNGELWRVKLRVRLKGNGNRFMWEEGGKEGQIPYGLWVLERELNGKGKASPLFIVDRTILYILEGESDTWCAWWMGMLAVGLPGKSSWQEDWIKFFLPYKEKIGEIRIGIEADAIKEMDKVARDFKSAGFKKVLPFTYSPYKDLLDWRKAFLKEKGREPSPEDWEAFLERD